MEALPPATTKLELEDGREIYLLGTAHVSQRSVEDVQALVEAVQPDTICVELDQMRLTALEDPTHWRNLDIFQVIREQKVLYLFSSLALSTFQRRIANELGIEPGAEMREGVKLAREEGRTLVLADRPVQATLKRTWANLGFFGKAKTLSALLGGLFVRESITAEDIEKLKERDHINEAMQAFAKAMPAVKGPLIDERDRYLMSKIEEAPGQRIVAIVGAAHVQGMLTYQGVRADYASLEEIPGPGMLWRVVKWLAPLAILAAFGWGYYKHQGQGLQEMLLAWVLPNAVFAALFTALAGAKPLTILVSLVGSPITSLNPTIGVGIFAGLCEAWQRKPKVADCEGIPEAMLSLKGVYANTVTRVMLVALAAGIGSSVGAWVGATWILTLL